MPTLQYFFGTIFIVKMIRFLNRPTVEIGRYIAKKASVHDRFIGYECKETPGGGCLHIKLDKGKNKLENGALFAAQLGNTLYV